MTTNRNREKFAIIGISCLFPEAATPDAFWQNLINGVRSTSQATAEQFGVDPSVYYDPERRDHDTTYALEGGYVREQITIPDGLDRASGWSLYVAEQALNDAGYLNRADMLAQCGLILGNLSFPTQESHQQVAPIYDAALGDAIGKLLNQENFQLYRDQSPPSTHASVLSPAANVAAKLGLEGGHFCLDAACASSHYAVALACDYLAAGKADLMLAGAVSAADALFVNMGFTHFGAYPENGNSRPLDANTEGLVSGEGAGLLLLKRYADAVRDGDKIYAVVGGIGLSNDGRGKHPLTPNSTGQILAFERAYDGDVDPRTVQYIECHSSGTPLGDKTELTSMDAFFGQKGAAPRIGSVKSNHGHLLTVAGLASMLKVILSMQHGQIPATIRVEAPVSSQHFSQEKVVRQNTPWTNREKVAGVNAFGFGGVSAHLVLQNRESVEQRPIMATPSTPAETKLAIVGMDAQFGMVEGVDNLINTIYDGTQHFTELPRKRWKGLSSDAPKGAYIESFEIDFLRFKSPPKEDDQPIPQHLLLLKVADNAVQDAQIPEDSNVAVIVSLGSELSLHQYRSRLDLSWQIEDSLNRAGITLQKDDIDDLVEIVKDALNPPAQVNQYTSYIGNIVSSRVSALWNLSGPAFTMSASANTVYKALEVAQMLLADPTMDAVVIGAVDLAGGVENVTRWANQNPINEGTMTMSFDQQANGWQVGEGAGAIVLKRVTDTTGQRVYATIEQIAIASGSDAETISRTAGDVLSRAGLQPGDVGYIEASASGIASQDNAEITGLNRAYALGETPEFPQTALGSIKANVGHAGSACGIASLIKTALCLYERMIPMTPNWSSPKHLDQWRRSAFYVAQESRTWFSPNHQTRYAAVSGTSEDYTYAHVLLSDSGVRRPKVTSGNSYLKQRPYYLFALDADDQHGLIHRLNQLESALRNVEAGNTAELRALAQWAFTALRNGRYAIAIVGDNVETLLREIQRAYSGLPDAFAKDEDWQTPTGSFFTTNPLGTTGGIAFVYPGAFNSYPQLCRDWLQLFPAAHDHLMTLTSDPGSKIADALLYPRSLRAPSRADVRVSRARLAEDQTAMMESGTTAAILYTHVIREIFKVKPDAAFGYSIGEGSMLWAMDAWYDGDSASEVFNTSPLFKTRLFGRKEAIREAWGLPAQVGNDFWASYVLTTTPAEVEEYLSHESHVYMTHINTPNEVVIAGDPTVCERIIEQIGCRSLKAPFEIVIHNEAMISEYYEFYKLHRWPVRSIAENVTFYSAADYEPIRLESDLIARSIARVSCKRVDFPRLIHRAYRDGVRIFIELGPGSTCSRWVSDTLKAAGREHLSVAVDNLRLDDHAALIKMLAKLISHRVSMDLSVLYEENNMAMEGRRLLRTVMLGGEPVREAILTEENRRRFGRAMAYAQVQQPMPVASAVMTASGKAQPEPVAVIAEPYTEQATNGDHGALLRSRLSGLRQFGESLLMQLQNPGVAQNVAQNVAQSVAQNVAQPQSAPQPTPTPHYTPRPPIFDTDRIDQFARGSIQACFGPEYAVYDTRRAPRIPNTDLMLVSRIVEVDATRLETKVGSRMVAEYDVPVDMWFYRDNAYPFTPYSMLMEMALQPCGFLSAYMGPTFDFLDIDFYFRNLDGDATLHHEVDLRGRTLTNEVILLSSTVLQGIIIQKYSFNMMLDGESFYTGQSTFGYFTLQALSSQAGLDMGNPPPKWHETTPTAQVQRVGGNRPTAQPNPSQPYMVLPKDQLAFMDEALVDANGGKYGQGYVFGTTKVTPQDWFLKCHFHQDPVMPGSLGLEAIVQAMHTYAIQANLGANLQMPRFGHMEDHKMVWKYRGQVLGDSDSVNVEVHIKQVERTGGRVNITADASLWKGTLRIYQFTDVAVSIIEA